MTQQSLFDLRATLPQCGRLDWIGVRPSRDVPMLDLDEVDAITGAGLSGDRYTGARGMREVTLIQYEHLAVVAALLNGQVTGQTDAPLAGEMQLQRGRLPLAPGLLRRNLLVSGINLLALQRAHFRVGDVVLAGTGQCHPCSKMERALGPGGYNAMRGHGGITARVIAPGRLRVGDQISRLTGEIIQ